VRINRTIVLVLGVVFLSAGLGVSYSQWMSGIQPWGQLLGDNFVFARSLPFTVGFGIALGFWRASGWRWGTERRASDGALRRFAPGTVVLHAVAAVALLVLIATGGWQYLKGLLDADSPIYMATVYRIHYIAASVLIFVTVALVTDWLLRGERSLTIGRGQLIRSLRGLAHELPQPLGATLGYILGLDLRRAAPPTDEFTFYERTISFPTWELAIGPDHPHRGPQGDALRLPHSRRRAVLGLRDPRRVGGIAGPETARPPAVRPGAVALAADDLHCDRLDPGGVRQAFSPGLVRPDDIRLRVERPLDPSVSYPFERIWLGWGCVVKYFWGLLGLLYALLSVYVGYLFVTGQSSA
jgi:hypothetical protein